MSKPKLTEKEAIQLVEELLTRGKFLGPPTLDTYVQMCELAMQHGREDFLHAGDAFLREAVLKKETTHAKPNLR